MLVAILFGTPITFALGIASLAFFIACGIPLEAFVQRLAVGVNSFPLLAVPFFILAGNLMNSGGITKRIFKFANSLVGHIQGGLGHVNVLSSMIFAGMSGSAIADAAGLGNIEIKAMTKAGFDLEFSVSVTAASAVIGPIIPPSTIMIIYGITAGVSVGALFMGGIIPGILMGLALMALVYFYSLKSGSYPKSDKFILKEVFIRFWEAFPALLAPFIIIGGILGGVFTPTEAGAVAVFYALTISFFYKEIKIRDLPKILFETAFTSGVVLFIVSTASIFGWCLSFERTPQLVATFMSSITTSKTLLMLMLTVVYLFLGMIMEAAAIVITTVPIIVPVLNALGINLVFFGVIISILMSIGTITPPVGTVMFILCKITGLSIESYTKSIIPWFLVLTGIVILLIFIPQLILFIPDLVK
jgi:tripartite ATP-independent transporter DctM subunit